MSNEPIHIISLGAGVQSSAMALMAARGDFQDLNGLSTQVTAAIFSDTQAEPKKVMEWLDYLEKEILKLPFGFPVYRVTAGNLREYELRVRRSQKSGKLYLKNSIPAFVKKDDGKSGLLGRRCTPDFKIIPLQRKTKEIMGLKRARRNFADPCKMWIGISTDEAHRMKPSRVNYIENVWPLVDGGISRTGCLEWMKKNGYPEPPRSACVFCPFHSDFEWIRMRRDEPEEFQSAVDFELELQAAARKQEVMKGVPFLHSSTVPLSQVEFKDKNPKTSHFGNECEGLCGV